MGLAASQARLLSITARMHDVEFQAQNIMNQKVMLATQEDAAYEEYCAALDAKKIQVAYTGADGKLNYVDATYATTCGYNSDRVGHYAMKDSESGLLIVDQDTYDVYKSMNGKDKYEFALIMMGLSSAELQDDLTNMGDIGIFIKGADNQVSADASSYCKYSGTFYDKSHNGYSGYTIMNDTEAAVYENHKDELESYMEVINEAVSKADETEITNAINEFRAALYNHYSSEIYSGICEAMGIKDLPDFDSDMIAEFKYYAQLYDGIVAAGGCTTSEDLVKDGDDGVNWFNNAITSGKVILTEYNSSGTKKGTWSDVSISLSTNFKEVTDEADIKKAEAKYDHELKQINRKDAKYDQDLQKLETERTALKTELDSIKKVKDDNIDRTFKIFS